jgi:DNA-directed RNA polymerase subunit RPC12/RpoP
VKLLVSRITLADGKAACPNCEHEVLPKPDVTKWVNTLGSDQPRMAFAKCL